MSISETVSLNCNNVPGNTGCNQQSQVLPGLGTYNLSWCYMFADQSTCESACGGSCVIASGFNITETIYVNGAATVNVSVPAGGYVCGSAGGNAVAIGVGVGVSVGVVVIAACVILFFWYKKLYCF